MATTSNSSKTQSIRVLLNRIHPTWRAILFGTKDMAQLFLKEQFISSCLMEDVLHHALYPFIYSATSTIMYVYFIHTTDKLLIEYAKLNEYLRANIVALPCELFSAEYMHLFKRACIDNSTTITVLDEDTLNPLQYVSNNDCVFVLVRDNKLITNNTCATYSNNDECIDAMFDFISSRAQMRYKIKAFVNISLEHPRIRDFLSSRDCDNVSFANYITNKQHDKSSVAWMNHEIYTQLCYLLN